MMIKFQKEITFNSPYECIYDKNELKKAILWYSKNPVARLKHIYLHGKYYALSIYDKKIHIHRLLMMFWCKRDLQTNEHVHHKDGNKFNNTKENLELLLASIHLSLTNKGRKLSELHKEKIGKANKNRIGMKFKRKYIFKDSDLIKIITRRSSILSMAKKYKCNWSTVDARLKEFKNENPELFNENI